MRRGCSRTDGRACVRVRRTLAILTADALDHLEKSMVGCRIHAMRFVLDVETEDWEITSSEGGFYDVVKVLHVHLSYVGSTGA